MITIDQLLESVDLDFEPRWVTKSDDNWVIIWGEKPFMGEDEWYHVICRNLDCGYIKLSEFDGKDWTECIYEVPRKTDEYEQNLEKLRPADLDLVYRVNLPRKTTGNEIEQKMLAELERKLNAIVDAAIDAVNELKAKFTLPALKTDLTEEDLREMMRDPKYWRDGDSATIKKIQNGFNKLYGDKNQRGEE